ncbi:MAG: PAS domain-containing protein [Actinomycetota bacterium]|nr:PAS domain-containing protein [Actinomycetota bacterium]
MADAVPVLIWTAGPDGGCTFVNRRWLEFTGRSLEDELGDGWTDNLYPDDRERCVADYRAALQRRAPFEMEYRLRRADGAWRWILVHGEPSTTPTGSSPAFWAPASTSRPGGTPTRPCRRAASSWPRRWRPAAWARSTSTCRPDG